MRANHSPLQFLGLIAMASAFVYGAHANAALAGTMAPTAEPSGASASLVPVATSPAPEAGPRSLVDATRTTVDPNGTSRALRGVINGRLLSRTSGPPESGTPVLGHPLRQVAATTAPAKTVPPAAAGRATRGRVGVAPLISGQRSVGAPTSGTDASATTTKTPPDPSLADSAGGSPVATQVSGSQPASRQPKAPPSTATQPVATPPTATTPVATRSVATQPVATQSLGTSSALVSGVDRGPRLLQLHASAARWLRLEKDKRGPLATPADAPSRAPINSSLGQAARNLGSAVGSSKVSARDADLDLGSANAAADSRQSGSVTPARIARTRAAASPPIPQVPASVPPVPARLPLGGAAAASGGAVGAVAPPAVAEVDALALVLAAVLLARFSLDRVAWRSALLVSRLDRPG